MPFIHNNVGDLVGMRRATLLAKAIRRAATIETPEQRLHMAVIENACKDAFLDSTPAYICAEARRFLLTDRVEPFSWAVGVDPEYLRELYRAILSAEVTP